ncbi:hypothetical protein OAQ81_01915 [Candidatus Thioglobus sp.]|nr:hypothetical protein [Candidatus Thioglobus sp.]
MKNIMFSIAGFGAISAGHIAANLLWILFSRIKADSYMKISLHKRLLSIKNKILDLH